MKRLPLYFPHSRLFLAILAALPSIFAMLITPALPLLINYFDVEFEHSQLPMSCFLLGYALGQLPYGPLSNRFGRRFVLHLGLLIAIVSCIGCVLAGHAHHFYLFLAARFFMAVGSSAGLHTAFTIVGDVYEKRRAIKVFSFIMLFSAVIPGISTCIGGVITEHLGWESCFYFLIFFGLVILGVSWYVFPETVQLDSDALKISKICKTYAEECSNRQLVLSSVITGCGAGIIYLFASSAPFIGMNLIGMDPDQYGIWAIFPSVGLAVGSFFTERISFRISAKQLLWLGVKILFAASLFSFGIFYFGHVNPWSLFFPMLCMDTGLAFVFSTTATIAVMNARNKAIGSSVMHFINLGICVLFIYSIGHTSIENPVMLPVLFLLLVVIISLLMRSLVKSYPTEESIA